MTTQAELLKLAMKKKDEYPAISTVLVSIAEHQAQARMSLGALSGISATRLIGVNIQEGFSVTLDNTDIIQAAAQASASMTCIASHFMTLACLLTQIGVEHSY